MKSTVLHAIHQKLGARLVEFGGYEMPVQYQSIIEEHLAVRSSAGLFDLCHMGRFEVRGEQAVAAVDAVVTNHVEKIKVGGIRYSLVCNEAGGVRDDILIYRMQDSVLLVVNAGNRDKLMAWFGEKLVRPGASLHDLSDEIAMIAVQGPKSLALLAPHITTTWVPSLGELGYYAISDSALELAGERYEGWVSRTGYTGEDGFELYVPSDRACEVWTALQEVGGDDLIPCGLGARDTLRLEAGMPLYGHELGEEINPLEVGLKFAIRFKKGDYIGKPALEKMKAEGAPRQLRAFSVDSKRVARDGMAVFAGDREVGRITSGAPSPSLNKNIAMALIASNIADETALEVQIRNQRVPLIPHSFPFYKRPQ